jgi:hypothetical protein
MDIQFKLFLSETENWHFNSEVCYFNSKNVFDLKIDIWILKLNYLKYQISISIQKIIIEF